MLVFTFQGGQLGNQLFCFSHLIANSINYEYPIYNLAFNYYHYFPKNLSLKYSSKWLNSHRDFICFFLGKIPSKLIDSHFGLGNFRYVNLGWNRTLNEFDSDFLKSARNGFLIIDGFGFRDFSSLHKYKSIVLEAFIPLDQIVFAVNSKLEKIRESSDVIVGVHIRRGDYANYLNGKFLFRDSVYIRNIIFIKEVLSVLNKKVSVIVTSNDPAFVQEKITSKISDTYLLNGSSIEDMYALSKCDYIIGPPSTFSGWASFYGDVPLFHFYTEEESPLIDRFKVYPG